MSTGSVPYIGSRMSLISKAEIRYEGFLHEIDTANTTVTLRDVRSFGTETRRSDKIIPPKDDVFQYIIFRGSDIKDISVCESPFTDPAIVQSGPPAPGAQQIRTTQPSTVASVTSPTSTGISSFGMPTSAPQAKPIPPSVPSPGMFHDSNTDPQQSPVQSENRHSDGDLHRSNKQPPNQRNLGPRQDNRPQRENTGYSGAVRQGQSYQPSRNYNNFQRGYEYENNRNYGNYSSYSSYRNQAPPQPMGGNGTGQMRNQNNRSYYPSYNRYQNYNGRYENQGNGTRNRNEQMGDNLKIDEEFDIDDANKKFDKSQLIKEFSNLNVEDETEVNRHVHELNEVEEGEVQDDKGDATRYYDKTKSFFDSISCDASEKKNSRLTTAEEKRLNVQTFGVPTVYRNARPNTTGSANQGYGPRGYGYNNQPRRGGGNYYGGYSNNRDGGAFNNYRRGNSQNNYYTSNYNASRGYRRGGGQSGQRQGDVLVQS